jgi:hypothetical protein
MHGQELRFAVILALSLGMPLDVSFTQGGHHAVLVCALAVLKAGRPPGPRRNQGTAALDVVRR